MIDISELIQRHLESLGLPVYNELSIERTTPTPCMTWRLDNDYTRANGDNLSFNWVQVSVKLWCNKKEVVAEYVQPISGLMRQLGFEQIGTNELRAGGITQLETRWRGTYRQNY